MEDRVEAPAQRRRRREERYVYFYRIFSHRDAVVRELIRLKVIGAVEPQGWRRPACERTKAHRNRFGDPEREAPAASLPWARLECDLYGPIKFGDRDGSEYLFAIICASEGVVFVQLLRAKSEAVAALWAFAK